MAPPQLPRPDDYDYTDFLAEEAERERRRLEAERLERERLERERLAALEVWPKSGRRGLSDIPHIRLRVSKDGGFVGRGAPATRRPAFLCVVLPAMWIAMPGGDSRVLALETETPRPAGWGSRTGNRTARCQGAICPVHPTIATTPRVCDPWRILPIALVWAWVRL